MKLFLELNCLQVTARDVIPRVGKCTASLLFPQVPESDIPPPAPWRLCKENTQVCGPDACHTGGCWNTVTSVTEAAVRSATDGPPTAAGLKECRVSEGHQLGCGHTTSYLHGCLQCQGTSHIGFTSLNGCAIKGEDSTAGWESAHAPGWIQRKRNISMLFFPHQAGTVSPAWAPSPLLFLNNESAPRDSQVSSLPWNSSLTLLKTFICPFLKLLSLWRILTVIYICILLFPSCFIL